MSQDAFGNYRANISPPPVDPLPGDIIGGGGGGGQLVEYEDGTDPSAIPPPDDPTQPAKAYAKGGTTSDYGWNTELLVWN